MINKEACVAPCLNRQAPNLEGPTPRVRLIVGFPASLAVGESKCIAPAIAEPPKNTETRPDHIIPSSKMKTTDEYKAAVSNAIAFQHENLTEKATVTMQVYDTAEWFTGDSTGNGMI
jgi:hypothetical protein